MITDGIIAWFGAIMNQITAILPEAPIVAASQGAAAGTQCCAAVIVGTMSGVLTSVCGGSCLNKSPASVLIDYGQLGFMIGCAFSILAAFFIAKILIFLWQQVKW